MRQSHAIADRANFEGQTLGSVEASQGQQSVFAHWGRGADGRLAMHWCKSRTHAECRATCAVLSRNAA